jgi:hypothetical protein
VRSHARPLLPVQSPLVALSAKKESEFSGALDPTPVPRAPEPSSPCRDISFGPPLRYLEMARHPIAPPSPTGITPLRSPSPPASLAPCAPPLSALPLAPAPSPSLSHAVAKTPLTESTSPFTPPHQGELADARAKIAARRYTDAPASRSASCAARTWSAVEACSRPGSRGRGTWVERRLGATAAALAYRSRTAREEEVALCSCWISTQPQVGRRRRPGGGIWQTVWQGCLQALDLNLAPEQFPYLGNTKITGSKEQRCNFIPP